jgi:hypothetical protein
LVDETEFNLGEEAINKNQNSMKVDDYKLK